MNPKVFVGAAVGVFAIILGMLAISGSSIISDVSSDGFLSLPSSAPQQVLPLEIELEDISILEVSDKAAALEVKFKVANPNYKAVILQVIKYQLFENGVRITGGQIGERQTGLVASSNYYTILNQYPTTLTDRITIKNTGNTPEFWSALTTNTPKWRITGEAFFNLSSMTSGQENEITFEFSK